ncbi:MAG: hypothetical protein FD180_2693 [Planctomycetota bacterium]|nr:MAG: hypothetical protein FD180_2693 [Planctomycetota bacterium]
MIPRRTLFALALLASIAAGCKRKGLTDAEMNAMVDQQLTKEAAAVKRLDALMELAAPMEAIPPTISAKAFGPLTGKARMSDALVWQKENVLCVMLESLKVGPWTVAPSLPYPTEVDWDMSRRFLKNVRAAKAAGQNYGHLMRKLWPAAQIEYVVVVRGTLTVPKMVTAKTFEAGGFVGDAQIFAIGDKTEHLGGVPLAATNSKDLSFREKHGMQEDSAKQALGSDLAHQLFVHLCRQLAQYGGVEIPERFKEEAVKNPGGQK